MLADPRFALLLASTAEALTCMDFQSRELSNIGWALAKLKIVPPFSAMPRSPGTDDTLLVAATAVRTGLLRAAKERQETGLAADSALWIPVVSQLSGQILDRISQRVALLQTDGFRLQEWANLLWAWATCGRADKEAFAAARVVEFDLGSCYSSSLRRS
jgi:hypothetical protein